MAWNIMEGSGPPVLPKPLTWRDGSRDEEEKCAGHDLICIAYKE